MWSEDVVCERVHYAAGSRRDVSVSCASVHGAEYLDCLWTIEASCTGVAVVKGQDTGNISLLARNRWERTGGRWARARRQSGGRHCVVLKSRGLCVYEC
jgi:hypothetical protein